MSSWNPCCEISVSDSEDDDSVLPESFYGREAIIFVIDSSLYKTADLLENALHMIRSAFLSGLLVNDKDLMGILFFNTEYTPVPFESNCLDEVTPAKNCAVFLPPRQLDNTIVNYFLNFVEIAPVEFGKVYGVASNMEGGNFSQMLRLSVDLVQHCNICVNSTTIVFITDNEMPHPLKSESYMQSLQKASDLKEKGIEFVLIPMKDDFNYDFFYKEFICLISNIDIDTFEPCNAGKLRDMLAIRKLRQNFVRRSLGHFKFELSPNLVLSAQYFGYYQKDKRPRKILLQRCDNAVVRKNRIVHAKKINSNLVEELRNVNIKHAFYEIVFSHSSIRLSYEQINRIRNIHVPGMVLLGFKPYDVINTAKYTKSCNFMYPDDVQVEGSKRLFRALWERCIIRKKIAICIFMCKRKSMPRYVALIPVCKNLTSDLNDLLPTSDGFKIVYLSAVSYIRNFDLSDWHLAEKKEMSDELHICEKLIKKFRLDYRSDVLSDPDLDQLQAKLLSLAFNINYETCGSQYFPIPSQQDERIHNILPNLKEVFVFDKDLPNKRTETSSNRREPSTKKVKISKNLDDKSLIMQIVANKTLNTYTKEELCYIAKLHFNRTVPNNIKKQDILDIIYNL